MQWSKSPVCSAQRNNRKGTMWKNCTEQELCIYLQALEEGYLPTCSSATNVSAPSKTIYIARRSYGKGKRMEFSPGFRFSMMPGNSMDDHGVVSPMSLQQDSHVSHSVSSENEWEKEMNEICGRLPHEFLARYDHDMHCWRMSQASLLADTLVLFSGIWPRSASMLDGKCIRHFPPERAIPGNGYSSLPTPLASDWRIGAKNTHKKKRLKPNGKKCQLRDLVDGGKLNPEWIEWLMGWPIGWSGLEQLGTDKFRRWLHTPSEH